MLSNTEETANSDRIQTKTSICPGDIPDECAVQKKKMSFALATDTTITKTLRCTTILSFYFLFVSFVVVVVGAECMYF